MTAETKRPSHSDPVHQSIDHMAAYFDRIGAEVTLHRYHEKTWAPSHWFGTIELDNRDRGIALKCDASASTLFDLVFDLYQKVKSVEEVGVPDEVFGRLLPPPAEVTPF